MTESKHALSFRHKASPEEAAHDGYQKLFRAIRKAVLDCDALSSGELLGSYVGVFEEAGKHQLQFGGKKQKGRRYSAGGKMKDMADNVFDGIWSQRKSRAFTAGAEFFAGVLAEGLCAQHFDLED
jgi:hypothetical protein